MAEPATAQPNLSYPPEPSYPSEDFARYRLLDLFKQVRLLMRQHQQIDYRLPPRCCDRNQQEGNVELRLSQKSGSTPL